MYNFAGCFLLWRGAAMKQEWIEPYLANVGQKVYLPGNTSCSRNASVALDFALGDDSSDKQAVLFVKLITNYFRPEGVMMNSEAYSSYPQEAEMLLKEGIYATILGYEDEFEITNKHERV